MKSDFQLQQDVRAELAWDPAVGASDVSVNVSDGVVKLTGRVQTESQKHATVSGVRRVSGVQAVAIELTVEPPADLQRSDTEIAAAARHALEWSVMVPRESVQILVEAGRLTLDGEVEWGFEREVAEHAVRDLPGLLGIHNRIRVRKSVDRGTVQSGIQVALAKQAERHARHVDVVVDGSFVTLRGQVSSSGELKAILGAAWSAPGVTAVNSELKVQE